MRIAAIIAFLILPVTGFADPTTQPTTQPEGAAVPPVYNFTMKNIAGQDVPLSKYAGKVVLMVNVASKCGFTPQYAGLEKLYEKYADKGFVIVGFPANDFKQQEPGTDEEISQFCTTKYGVKFDMFSKIVVLGDQKAPLYQYLTANAPEKGEVKWNFEKFLIGKDGHIVARYRSKITPESDEMVKAIEAELAK
jgi:glutathione peroxidase